MDDQVSIFFLSRRRSRGGDDWSSGWLDRGGHDCPVLSPLRWLPCFSPNTGEQSDGRGSGYRL